MSKYGMVLISVFILALVGAVPMAATPEFDHQHSLWTRVLSQVVQDGRIDYVHLRKNPEDLNAYVKTLAGVSAREFEKFSLEQQVAYWVNLYNAQVIKIVTDHYPILPKNPNPQYPRSSIRQIDGVWTKFKADSPLGRLSLNQIEAGPLAKLKEPRLNFVLVNATVGGPKIRPAAVKADDLQDQLEEAARDFILDPENVLADAPRKRLVLNTLFKWKASQFVPRYYKMGAIKRQSKEEIALMVFLIDHVRPMQKMFILQSEFTIEFKPFDWSLNER